MMNPMTAPVILGIVAIVSLAMGFFIYFCPLKVSETQKNFYAVINWRIEPIFMEIEIRNTKIMGLALVVFVSLAGGYAFGY